MNKILTFVQSNIITLLIVVGVFFLLWQNQKLKAELDNQRGVIGKVNTLNQEFIRFKNSVISKGVSLNEMSRKDLDEEIIKAFGTDLKKHMDKNSAKLAALSTSVGQVYDKVSKFVNSIPPGVFVQYPNGGFKGMVIEQDRGDKKLPPLTKVEFNYDPDLPKNEQFASKWYSYKENFVFTIGKWEKKEKGGFLQSASLKRVVTDSYGKETEEPITIQDSNFALSDEEFKSYIKIPRWTIGFYTGYNLTNEKKVAGLIIDYRLIGRFGIIGGFMGSTMFGGITYRSGSK
jgi:hypothetical protein